MKETRIDRAKRPLVPATASSRGLGYMRLGSAQSRAAARALVIARQESEAEDDWDAPLKPSADLAEYVAEARSKAKRGEMPKRDWAPIYIPPGKENTVRGRLITRINEARARMRQLNEAR